MPQNPLLNRLLPQPQFPLAGGVPGQADPAALLLALQQQAGPGSVEAANAITQAAGLPSPGTPQTTGASQTGQNPLIAGLQERLARTGQGLPGGTPPFNPNAPAPGGTPPFNPNAPAPGGTPEIPLGGSTIRSRAEAARRRSEEPIVGTTPASTIFSALDRALNARQANKLEERADQADLERQKQILAMLTSEGPSAEKAAIVAAATGDPVAAAQVLGAIKEAELREEGANRRTQQEIEAETEIRGDDREARKQIEADKNAVRELVARMNRETQLDITKMDNATKAAIANAEQPLKDDILQKVANGEPLTENDRRAIILLNALGDPIFGQVAIDNLFNEIGGGGGSGEDAGAGGGLGGAQKFFDATANRIERLGGNLTAEQWVEMQTRTLKAAQDEGLSPQELSALRDALDDLVRQR